MSSWISQKPKKQIFINRPTTSLQPPSTTHNILNQNQIIKYNNLPIITYDISDNYYEIKNKLRDTVFIILRHSKNIDDFNIFKRNFHSIKTFYPENQIIIIDDHSPYTDLNFDISINCIIIQSEFKGAGEILPYYYYYKYKWAKNMIFLQDSMAIYRHFKLNEINHPCKFFWHFKIDINMDDELLSIINNLISALKNSELIRSFFLNNYNNLNGCFGSTMIINEDIIVALEEKYNLFTILTGEVNNRRQREALERILAIILILEGYLSNSSPSMFGSINEYPFSFSDKVKQPLDLNFYKYDSAISKIWRGR